MTVSINWNATSKATDSVLDMVGRTPLVRLNKISKEAGADIYGKIEWYSMSGSLKDRIYKQMFEEAEKRGDLRPGMTVLECSTGNAGIACSFLAAVKGYKCIIVMPVGMSEERKKLDIAYGSEMVYTPGGESDVDLALEKLEELRSADPDKYWVPAQFENSDNISAHEATTGPEIWEQMEGVIDIFVASQGTGGTLTGVGKYLKSVGSNAQLYAVEPSECPLLSKREWGEHKIEGIGDGFVPKNLHLELLSGIVTTTSDESLEMARRLAREEGLLCGISSGCNVVAALKLAKKFPEAKRIVTMLNDTGQRYFSTELMGEAKEVEIPDREHPMNDYTKQELDKYQSAWTIVN